MGCLAFGAEADIASREAALLKAHEHGLNLAQIACRTVELVLAGIRDVRPIPSHLRPLS